MKVVIIDYNAGNVQSVLFALKRIGAEAELSCDTEIINAADKLIFPGVGEASSAMNMLRERGLDKTIKEFTKPVLGICLGMQLMTNYSEEGNTNCLGIFDTQVEKFNSTEFKIPHVGWNNIEGLKGALFKGIKENEYMYFVHSYFVQRNNFEIANTNYIDRFCSAMQKDNFYAMQFHPERSGTAGEQVLKNFIEL